MPLLGPTPDHSTLNRFHAWLTEHHPAAFFEDVLTFLDQVDPEDPASTPQIDVGKALLKSRWHVEPTIAWLVRYHGCRQARRCGQAAAKGQLLMACGLRNLLLWLKRLSRGQARQPTAEQLQRHP